MSIELQDKSANYAGDLEINDFEAKDQSKGLDMVRSYIAYFCVFKSLW